MSVTSDTADLAVKFQQATAELTIRDTGRAQVRDHWTWDRSLARLQFDDPATNTGYVSEWPQWAFGLAQAALLGGKEVLLVANGDPFGANLVDVLILA